MIVGLACLALCVLLMVAYLWLQSRIIETSGSVERFRTETRYHFDTSRVIVNTKDCTKMVPCKVDPDSIEESCTNCKQLNSHCVHFDEETLIEIDGVPVLVPPGETPNDGICLQQADRPSIECNVWGEYVLARVTPESQAWICRCKYPNVFDSDTLLGDCTVKHVCLHGTLSNTDTGLIDDLVCTCDDGYVEYLDSINLPRCRTNLLFIDGKYAKIEHNKIVEASEGEYFFWVGNVPRVDIDKRFSRGRKRFANVKLLSPTDLSVLKIEILKLNYHCGNTWNFPIEERPLLQYSNEYMFGSKEFPGRIPMTIHDASAGKVSDLHDLLMRPWTWNPRMGFQNMQTVTTYDRTQPVESLWTPMETSYWDQRSSFNSLIQSVIPIFLKIVLDPVSDEEAWYDLPWGPLFYNIVQPRYNGPVYDVVPFEDIHFPLQKRWHPHVNTAIVSLTGLTDPTTDIFQSRLWGVYNWYIGWVFTPFPYYNTGASEHPYLDIQTCDPNELKKKEIVYVDSYKFRGEADEDFYYMEDGFHHFYYDTQYETGSTDQIVSFPQNTSNHNYMATVPLSIPKENVSGAMILHMNSGQNYFVLYHPIKSDSELDANNARREKMLAFLVDPGAGYYDRVSMSNEPRTQKSLSVRTVPATYGNEDVEEGDAIYQLRPVRGPVSFFDIYESHLNVQGGWQTTLDWHPLYRYKRNASGLRIKRSNDEEETASATTSRKRIRST